MGAGIATLFALLFWGLLGSSSAEQLNPIEQTIQLLTQLQASVVRDGEQAEAAYQKYANWCDSACADRAHEIKLAKRSASKLEAAIQEAESDIKTSNSKIEKLAETLFANEKKTKATAEVRVSERATFETAEQELIESIDMLDKAIRIMQKEIEKHGASFMQSKAGVESVQEVLLGLTAVVEAAGLPASDQEKLMALLQDHAGTDENQEESLGAPDGKAYEAKHSSDLLELMQDLRDKAESQLRSTRTAEKNAEHNFELLKTSLKHEEETAQKEMSDEKAAKSASEEAKAAAEGDLSVTQKQVKEATEALQNTQQACMQTAADHEHSVAGRKAELKAVTEAKQKIQASMAPAGARTYSFVQVGSKKSHSARSALRRTSFHSTASLSSAIMMVKRLSQDQKSKSLEQLASRLLAVARYGEADGADPFVKVKRLIQDMIRKLTLELNQEARRKTYCDREMNKTESRQDVLQDQVEGLRSKVDQLISKNVELKGQVQDLQTELADLAQLQANMDKARAEEHKAYLSAKADLQQGLDGTRAAIRVLRDFYASQEDGSGSLLQMQDAATIQAKVNAGAGQPSPPVNHQKAEGAGAGIIGLLEVIESDISENMAKSDTEEDSAQTEYERLTEENRVLKTTKERDVVYKSKESKSIEKAIAELGNDHDSATNELGAVNEYMSKVKEQCVAKPESYEERKERREEEIEGLQEALGILTADGAASGGGGGGDAGAGSAAGGGTFLQQRKLLRG